MAINYKICPKCGSKDTVKILYGYPSGEGIMLEAAGKVKLGGCLIDIEYSPEYHCDKRRGDGSFCLGLKRLV